MIFLRCFCSKPTEVLLKLEVSEHSQLFSRIPGPLGPGPQLQLVHDHPAQAFAPMVCVHRDPLHLGLPNAWALRLIRRLLQWTPDRRLAVSRIEKHAFFKEQIDEVTGESFFANEGWTCPNDASGFVYEFSDECTERCNTMQCV